jgi:hypothetical protein
MQEITVEIAGKVYSGRYEVTGRPGRQTVRVTSAFGGRAAQVGGSSAESLARLLLSELVREGAGRG